MAKNLQKKRKKCLAIILAGMMALSAAAPMATSAAQLPQEAGSLVSTLPSPAVPSIKNTQATVGKGETMSLSYMGRSAGVFANYIIESSDASVVKAWRYGSTVKYTGLKSGTATITVTEITTGAKDSIVITVKDPVNPKLAKSSVTMTVGDTEQVSYMKASADLFRFYTVTSSNSKVVSAGRYGSTVKLTAKSAGTATVTVTACDGVKSSMKVTVRKAPVKPSIYINSAKLVAGEVAQVSYMPKSAAPFENYTVTSSNENVVYAVRYGSTVRFVGIDAGTATITVTEKYSGAKDSFTVTVRRAVTPMFDEYVLERLGDIDLEFGVPIYIPYMSKSADDFSYYTVKSSNPSVATASRYGSTVKLTPKGYGDTVITVASISGDVAELYVTFYPVTQYASNHITGEGAVGETAAVRISSAKALD